MAVVKKLIEFARNMGLENIAKVLESAYVDDCNSSVATEEELEEIKKEMPGFMVDHGMPKKHTPGQVRMHQMNSQPME